MTEKLKASLKLTRPINIVITFISVFIAALIIVPDKIPGINVLLAAIAASLTAAAGNIINDLYDIEIDKINRPQRPLPSGIIKAKEATVLAIIFTFLSLIISYLVSYSVFYIVIISHLILFLYSKYLKHIPLLGNISVAFLTGLVFIYGGVVLGKPSAAIVPALFAFLINFIREIVKDMHDVKGDEKSALRTFPIKYGFQKSKILILIFITILIIFSIYIFINQFYRIEFFLVVMILVNSILVYCIKILFEDDSLKNLKKISNLLKLSMSFGLIAIYLGA